MKNQKKHVLFVTQGALIAALYVVLTVFVAAFNLASGAIQVRISEALTILPYFTPAAIPGLFIGCLISNIVAGGVIWDVIFGSLATLIGAIATYLLRKGPEWLAPIPPILSNTLIIPFVLRFAYGLGDAWWILFGGLFVGELISCGVFGMILLYALKSRRVFAGMIENKRSEKKRRSKKESKNKSKKKAKKEPKPDFSADGSGNKWIKKKKKHKKNK